MSFYWVNLGSTHNEVKDNQFLWAPHDEQRRLKHLGQATCGVEPRHRDQTNKSIWAVSGSTARSSLVQRTS